MGIYNRYILPPLLNCCCGISAIEELRKQWLPIAHGDVIEIGIGSGLSLPFYNYTKINTLSGLDSSPELLKMASTIAEKQDIDIDLVQGDATSLPYPDNSADSVVIMYTMCSITDVSKVLKEIIRILKPSGQFIFFEHGKSPEPSIFKWQKRLSPLWSIIFGGCRVDKDIAKLVTQSGFSIQAIDNGYLENTPKIAGYYVAGSADIADYG